MNNISAVLVKFRRYILSTYIKISKKIILKFIFNIFNFFLFKQKWKDQLFYHLIDNHKIIKVSHENISYTFYSLSLMTKKRYVTLFTKEPDTIKWINSFEDNKVFWDIGANVGIYSIYYASKNKNSQVLSFEPSVFNIEILARNIVLNNLTKNISIIPIALNKENKIDYFNMNNTLYGGALSGFGVEYDENFEKREINFSYLTNSLSINTVKDIYDLEPPNYIKIDVDGIEDLILEGGDKVFDNPKIETVLIENAGNYKKINNLMFEFGFKLESTYKSNQIWNKNIKNI